MFKKKKKEELKSAEEVIRELAKKHNVDYDTANGLIQDFLRDIVYSFGVNTYWVKIN